MELQMSWQPQHERRRKAGPPLGLKNLGNSCYLNSVLQCLTYTPPLAHFCLSSLHSSSCKSNLVECAFCILEQQIARSLSVEGPTADTPAKIHNRIALFAKNFRWGQQEDAHEFLRYVIDACHNTCLKLLKKGKEKDKPPPSNSTTVMREIFGGSLLSQVKCLSCKGESNKTDEIMDISLDLLHSNSLVNALDHFFQPEVLDGNNKYNCSKCKKLSVAKKQMFIRRAPNVLVIQLKRFEGIYGGKINRNIEFEEVLVLSKFMCSTNQDLQPEYNLFGSIVHSGYSPESGHYYAYIKDPSGRWYSCNDAHVSLSSAQEVLSEKVYILFYIRNNRDSKSKSNSPCNGKSSDSNGSESSSCLKSELLRPPIVKPNGVLASKNNVSSVLKNGKVSPNPQIKAISIKNLDVKKVIANGNGNILVHNNGGVGNNGYNKLSPSGKKSTPLPENGSEDNGALGNNGYNNRLSPSGKKSTTLPENECGDSEGVWTNRYNKLSPSGKMSTTLPKNGSGENSKVFHKMKISPTSQSNVAGGNSSLGNGRKKLSQVPNGNNCINPQKKELHEKATQDGEVVREQHCNNLSNNVINETYGTTSASKRKSNDTKRPESSKFCTQDRTPGDLEKFKEVIAAEASSNLRSCGWFDGVHDFMSVRKRRCTQVIGSSDETELRKQLIMDARKNFLSQIPESLKESLIERLKSFSKTNALLGS